MFVAHVAGIPLEETALVLAPVAATAGGLAGLKLRRLAGRWRLPSKPLVRRPR